MSFTTTFELWIIFFSFFSLERFSVTNACRHLHRRLTIKAELIQWSGCLDRSTNARVIPDNSTDFGIFGYSVSFHKAFRFCYTYKFCAYTTHHFSVASDSCAKRYKRHTQKKTMYGHPFSITLFQNRKTLAVIICHCAKGIWFYAHFMLQSRRTLLPYEHRTESNTHS